MAEAQAELDDKGSDTEDDEEKQKPRPRARARPTHARATAGVQGKHGRRINPRKGIPMHIMATYALLRLPDREGNLSDMALKIEENHFFSKQLDWTPRPGTKTYPRCVCFDLTFVPLLMRDCVISRLCSCVTVYV